MVSPSFPLLCICMSIWLSPGLYFRLTFLPPNVPPLRPLFRCLPFRFVWVHHVYQYSLGFLITNRNSEIPEIRQILSFNFRSLLVPVVSRIRLTLFTFKIISSYFVVIIIKCYYYLHKIIDIRIINVSLLISKYVLLLS